MADVIRVSIYLPQCVPVSRDISRLIIFDAMEFTTRFENESRPVKRSLLLPHLSTRYNICCSDEIIRLCFIFIGEPDAPRKAREM